MQDKAFAQASTDHYTTLAKEMAPVGTSVGVLSLSALDEAYMAKAQLRRWRHEVVLTLSVNGKGKRRSVEIVFLG